MGTPKTLKILKTNIHLETKNKPKPTISRTLKTKNQKTTKPQKANNNTPIQQTLTNTTNKLHSKTHTSKTTLPNIQKKPKNLKNAQNKKKKNQKITRKHKTKNQKTTKPQKAKNNTPIQQT